MTKKRNHTKEEKKPRTKAKMPRQPKNVVVILTKIEVQMFNDIENTRKALTRALGECTKRDDEIWEMIRKDYGISGKLSINLATGEVFKSPF